jgi:hypothetical protein
MVTTTQNTDLKLTGTSGCDGDLGIDMVLRFQQHHGEFTIRSALSFLQSQTQTGDLLDGYPSNDE